MNSYALIVDSGYCYRESFRVLNPSPESTVVFDEATLIRTARAAAETKMPPPSSFLRTYWFDLRADEASLVPYPALRASEQLVLRIANAVGEPAAEIVHAMIFATVLELARNRAVTDIVILGATAADSLLVMFAQGYGVRIHTIQIATEPDVQSTAQPDSSIVWGPEIVSLFLRSSAAKRSANDGRPADGAESRSPEHHPSVRPPSSPGRTGGDETSPTSFAKPITELFYRMTPETAASVRDAVEMYVEDLTADTLTRLARDITETSGIPQTHDGQLLRITSNALDRPLEPDDKSLMRRHLRKIVLEAAALPNSPH